MVHQGGVHTRARTVVDAKVVELRIPPEEVALLGVDHELLHQLVVLEHVEVEASLRLAGPDN